MESQHELKTRTLILSMCMQKHILNYLLQQQITEKKKKMPF